jgi:Protein of unknown function (DUF1360)
VNLRLSMTGLLIVLLAVWRITHLFWGEDGPGDVFLRVRKLAGQSFLGRLLDCFYCLSLWVAVPFAWWLADRWIERIVLWFGLSGGAILLERVTAEKPQPPVAQWSETPAESQAFSTVPAGEEKSEEHPNVLLR